MHFFVFMCLCVFDINWEYTFFRDIREPKQVKLVYDVLKFDPPEIEKAVLFATNNALVCETPDDAMKVAYEIDRSRYDVSIKTIVKN